jgi:hypothetical protein
MRSVGKGATAGCWGWRGVAEGVALAAGWLGDAGVAEDLASIHRRSSEMIF